MSDFIPYSEKQKILTPKEWESQRFLDADCPTAQVAVKMMRAVVKRLLQIDKNIDINDFVFLVYEDESPNAAFVPSHYTQNGKHIIMISPAITQLCKTEDEFAGILAHELGHFTYDKIYGKNENTIFQERFSDLHAVDLLIAGGYDPSAYSRVCEEMRKFSGPNIFPNVHGSDVARQEDVDAYLTKKHKEQGDFQIIAPTGLYKEFARAMNNRSDTYKPYFIQAVQQHFNNRQPKLHQLLDFVISQMRIGKINSNQRINYVISCITNMPKQKSIKHTQQFLEQLIEIKSTDKTINDILYDHTIEDLCKIMIERFRDGKPFRIFEPFTSTLAMVNEFMTTRDLNRIKELVVKLTDNNIFHIKRMFGVPHGFSMPPRKSAKNKTMPTDWLCSISHEQLPELSSDEFTRLTIGIKHIINSIGYDCDYEWLTDDYRNRGGSGKIIATNKKEIVKIINQQQVLARYTSNHNSFNNFMKAITVLYEFDTGKISVIDAIKSLAEYGNRPVYDINSIVYWMHDRIVLSDYKHNNLFVKQEIAELDNSVAFTEMCIKPFLKLLKQIAYDISPELEKQINLKNPPRGQTWFEYMGNLSKVLGLKRDVYIHKYTRKGSILLEGKNLDNINHLIHQTGIPESQEHGMWNTKFGPITYLASVNMNKINSIFMKFVNAAVANGYYSAQEAADLLYHQIRKIQHMQLGLFSENPILDRLATLDNQNINKLMQDLIENYSVFANRTQWISHNYPPILDALDDEIELKQDLHKIKRVLTLCNMLAHNEQELIAIMSAPIQTLKSDSYYSLEAKLKMYAFTYYLRKNAPIKNLYPILYGLCTCDDRISEFTSDFTDELSDYIEKHNLIPTDFQSRFDLYAVMERLNLFSKESSMQSNLLDMLIEQIQQMSKPDIEKYSYKLLSGFYYDDDDARAAFFNREQQNMDFTLVKKRLMEMYSDVVAERLGCDDNSDKYIYTIKKLIDFIRQEHSIKFHGGYNEYLNRLEKLKQLIRNKQKPARDDWDDWCNKVRHAFSNPNKTELYRLLSDKIQSQERVSKLFADDKNIVLSDKNAQDNDWLGQGVEHALDELQKHPELSIYTIEFLNTKLTNKSVSDFRNKCAKYITENQSYAKLVSQQSVINLYNTFWSSGLEVRALIMNKLLNRAFDTLQDKIKYVCNMNFDKNNKYRKDAEMIFDCVINAFEPYEQSLILSAVASADENKQEGKHASRNVGDGLRMFFENMGPAWVKFGQLLSYVPQLPSEIRHDLGKLKDNADIPARWDLYNDMADALPNELINRITRVEDIIGAGSFWVTAIVQFKNDNGKVEKKVLQLLRPYAAERAQAGFETIERAITELSKRNSSYKILKNVAHQARESAKYEVDVVIGNKQYEKAKELYGDIAVNIDGTTYTPNVADWRYYGTGKNAIGYKIMDYASGKTLDRVKASDDIRRKMALAYFTTEMTILFKGDVWDIDRHQGQQNFDMISPRHVNVNIYDTGAQMPNAPDNKNKVLLASVFFGLIRAVQSGKSIDSYILKTIKKLDKIQNKLKIDVSYVSNVQKGLMALSDIIEYQKELKDPDGNIIQERKTLSDTDLKNAIIAVLQNPTVDKYIKVVISGRLVANKLTHLEIQALKDLANGDIFANDNPVKINIIGNNSASKSKQYQKAGEEIVARENTHRVMGIDTKHTNPDNTVIDELRQLGFALT